MNNINHIQFGFNILKILIITLIAFVAIDCGKKSDNTENYRFVHASGGLKLRESPDVNSNPILTIPNFSQVLILEEAAQEVEISGKKGKWTKVKFQDKEGWVFGGFLKIKNEIASSYSITFENHSQSMFSITFNSDNTFVGECYNGYSASAKWEGKFKQIDTENFQINGVATSYYYGESEEIISSKFESIVTIKEKNGKTQIYNISTNPIPGCNEISIKEGVLKNSAYGEYKYWDFL